MSEPMGVYERMGKAWRAFGAALLNDVAGRLVELAERLEPCPVVPRSRLTSEERWAEGGITTYVSGVPGEAVTVGTFVVPNPMYPPEEWFRSDGEPVAFGFDEYEKFRDDVTAGKWREQEDAYQASLVDEPGHSYVGLGMCSCGVRDCPKNFMGQS